MKRILQSYFAFSPFQTAINSQHKRSLFAKTSAGLACVLVALFLPLTLKAQTPTPTPTPTPDPEGPVHVRVSVMAPQIVSDTFGKRIAQNFVAIQVTVANHDKDFQYLINDVSLSLGHVFSRSATDATVAPCKDASVAYCPDAFYLSSAELSLLRGVAEKGQGQDKRNKFLRIFRGVGTVAAGLIGVASFGPSYPAAVAVFNGPVISAYSEAFPDYTINQMNRLNDSAYTANTLVPQKHSKVLVAFLPQAIFLSKEERKQFWADPTALYEVGGKCTITKCVDFRKAQAWIDGDFITQVSNMPAIVSDAQFLDSEKQKFEEAKPVVKGALVGRFLTGTSIDFFDVPEGLSISKDGEPTADRLNFVIKSNKPVPPGTKLNFVVSGAQGREQFQKELRYMPDPPTLTKVDPPSGKQNTSQTVTLTGTNFIPGPGRTTVMVSGGGVDVSEPVEVLGTSLKVTLKISQTATPTKRSITVKNDNSVSPPVEFTIIANP